MPFLDYLHANRGVLIHVSESRLQEWFPPKPTPDEDGNTPPEKPPSHASEWFAAMRLEPECLVSGRVLARIVHLPERLSRGGFAHPQLLLSAKDAAMLVMGVHLEAAAEEVTFSRKLPVSNVVCAHKGQAFLFSLLSLRRIMVCGTPNPPVDHPASRPLYTTGSKLAIQPRVLMAYAVGALPARTSQSSHGTLFHAAELAEVLSEVGLVRRCSDSVIAS